MNMEHKINNTYVTSEYIVICSHIKCERDGNIEYIMNFVYDNSIFWKIV